MAIVDARQLYEGHYEEVAGYREQYPDPNVVVPHRVYTADSYMLRYQGNDGFCKLDSGEMEKGKWYLAFIPPHRFEPRKILDPHGKLRTLPQVHRDQEQLMRIFVPERLHRYPMYRPFTFQVPRSFEIVARESVSELIPPVIAQVPGAWWGNVLAPEEDRIELVSVNRPPELAPDQNNQPTFLSVPEQVQDPVEAPREPQLTKFTRMAPNYEYGVRVESPNPRRRGTRYRVHFPPHLICVQPTIGNRQYPKQLVMVQYPPQNIFLADGDEWVTNYRNTIPLHTSPIQVAIRGTFEKKFRPKGPDGTTIDRYPDTHITLPGRLFRYLFCPMAPDLIRRLPEVELQQKRAYQFMYRGPPSGYIVGQRLPPVAQPDGSVVQPPCQPLPDGVGWIEEAQLNRYETGLRSESTAERALGTWFTSCPMSRSFTPVSGTGRGAPLPTIRYKGVTINVPLKLYRVPATKKYMAWKVYPDDVKVYLYTGAGDETEEVTITPDSFDFYPIKGEKQKVVGDVDKHMSKLPVLLRALRDPGRGPRALPDPRVSDFEPEVGIHGPLQPGEEEPFPPFAGELLDNLPSPGPPPGASQGSPPRGGEGSLDTRSRHALHHQASQALNELDDESGLGYQAHKRAQSLDRAGQGGPGLGASLTSPASPSQDIDRGIRNSGSSSNMDDYLSSEDEDAEPTFIAKNVSNLSSSMGGYLSSDSMDQDPVAGPAPGKRKRTSSSSSSQSDTAAGKGKRRSRKK
ncbi:hypothetical protein HDE_04977 [Halotydeus destructor]|nr:hypothetical protein HDE_04977 [Halotydeus destructor]